MLGTHAGLPAARGRKGPRIRILAAGRCRSALFRACRSPHPVAGPGGRKGGGAAPELPTLADLGYEGEAVAVRVPIKKTARETLTDDQKTTNLIHPIYAARPNGPTPCSRPHSRRSAGSACALGAITAAALVLLHQEHGRTT